MLLDNERAVRFVYGDLSESKKSDGMLRGILVHRMLLEESSGR